MCKIALQHALPQGQFAFASQFFFHPRHPLHSDREKRPTLATSLTLALIGTKAT